MTDAAGIVILLGFILAVFFICAGIYRKVKKRSGSATILLGATHDILNEDLQRAAEVIVEREAKKKMGEEESGEPEEPGE